MKVGEVLVSNDGIQYYYDVQYNAEKDEYRYLICRYDPNTKKTDVLAELKDPTMVLIDKIDGNLYYIDGIGLGVFDEETGDTVQQYQGYAGNVSHDAEYFYFRDQENLLYRLPIGGSVAEPLTDFPVRYYYLTDRYIYYKIVETVIVGQYANGADADIGSQKIYRMNKDGSGNELVWAFTDGLARMNCDYFVVEGSYLYSKFFWWDEERQYFLESQNSGDNGGHCYLIRIDLNRQNVHFIDMTP
jgi:hypothetical protein